MSDAGHERFMRIAIEESRRGGAAGNVAVGSVVVRDGAVIGAGHNTVASDRDLTCHAEVMAIRDACRREETLELPGSTLYTAMEPCPMCLWAIALARIERIVLGARHAAFVRPELGRYSIEALIELTGVPIEVVTGVLEAECRALRPELAPR